MSLNNQNQDLNKIYDEVLEESFDKGQHSFDWEKVLDLYKTKIEPIKVDGIGIEKSSENGLKVDRIIEILLDESLERTPEEEETLSKMPDMVKMMIKSATIMKPL